MALLGTTSLVLGSSRIREDQMGRVHVQDMCSQDWADSRLVDKGAAFPVGTSRESSRMVLAVHSH